MASSSSSSVRSRNQVFASFYGPDVRKTFISHLRKQLNENGIIMFDDQGIESSQTISPVNLQAIRESRISIMVLSKNYASSSWCLDELSEVIIHMREIGQIVMPVFYGVDPSDVRKQTGEFGKLFREACARKTAEERLRQREALNNSSENFLNWVKNKTKMAFSYGEDQYDDGVTEERRVRWSRALTDVASVVGELLENWDDESKMIQKIARDISDKLNVTVSRDFEDMVGTEAHLERMQSLLHLDEDEAMIVGICGPAGIGKTTIARALHSRLSGMFQLTCFMENLKGSYHTGLDEYGLKLRLQEKLLSKIFKQNGMELYHLGAIKERLCDQKVLIVLDDVDDLNQLEALANETNWFDRGSRIIITTENQELLLKHGINNKKLLKSYVDTLLDKAVLLMVLKSLQKT